MEIGDVKGVQTVLALGAYLGVVWWAYRSSNRARFEQDALLPFGDEPPQPSAAERREGRT